MGSPTIFNGSAVKLLKNIMKFFNGTQIQAGSANPTSSATDGEIGDLYISTSTGLTYRKTDSGSSTNWTALGGSSTFAGLTDLTSAVVPAVTMTTNNGGAWQYSSAHTNTEASTLLDTNATNATRTDYVSSSSAYAELSLITDETNACGYIYESGSKDLEDRVYNGATTDLGGLNSLHIFTADPTGNVGVNYLKQRNLFYVINKSGGNVTLEQDTTETFNGATTIVLANNKAYTFIAPTNSTTYFVFASM